jgi:hypothetical protein
MLKRWLIELKLYKCFADAGIEQKSDSEYFIAKSLKDF